MCCCTNYQDVFTWIGAIILNIACVTIITTSSEQNTWTGTILSAFYASCLYLGAQHIEQKKKKSTAQIALTDEDNQTTTSSTQTETESSTISMLQQQQQQEGSTYQLIVSAFYGLSILALGTTGALLAISLLPEHCGDYYNDEYDVCQKAFVQKQAFINIFTTILPMLGASVYLWNHNSVPSTAVTAYFAITLLGSAMIALFDPYWEGEHAPTVYKWFITLTSLTWTLLLSYRYITSDESSKKDSYSWGINMSALGFFGIMFVMVDIYNDTLWSWVLVTVLSFIPLIVLGLVIEHNFILFLGASGLLLDIWRLATHLPAILQFVVFGAAGVGLLVFGSWLKQNRDLVREPFLQLILGGDDSLITGYQIASENGFNNNMGSLPTENISCCSDTQDIFAWVGAFIVNIAFLSIISLTVETNIFIGFFLSAIYTGLLYKMAEYFGNNENESSEWNDATPSDPMHTKNDESAIKVPIIQGIFYGLSILALGTSGVLLSLAIDSHMGCQGEGACVRREAILFLFFSIIPMTVASLYLWIKKYVPSCGLTAYLGVVLFGAALLYIFDPDVFDAVQNPFYKLWLLVSSLTWTLALAYRSLSLSGEETTSTIASAKKASYTWGINFGALVFFSIMFEVVKIYHDTIWNWFLVNIFSFIPLIVLGIVIDHNLIVFLGVFGLYLDIIRLTSGLEMMLQFVLLGFSGIGVVALGSWLKSNQEIIRAPFLRMLGSGNREVQSEETSSASEGLTQISQSRAEQIGVDGAIA